MSEEKNQNPQEDAAVYRVLARKYRPQSFKDLIGQETMVRILSNAIEINRLAHAFMLTGVRGIGKTSTARILAKAFNCVGADEKGGVTVDPCGVCAHCVSITEDRHLDVIELDAASRTGVDDVRELIESVRYRPVSARFKVYIIDEVHMLSKSAFNALLKTLEEPPAHVKFIFATTEINKIPVTILSRCQRFDLRRVELEQLETHFLNIAKEEAVELNKEAAHLIAKASDGSVRDGLSLLDQAISLGTESIVDEESVIAMLGLKGRDRILDLYAFVVEGKTKEALEHLRSFYIEGGDPMMICEEMLAITHSLTKLKFVAETDLNITESERQRLVEMSLKLGVPALTRNWQMLLKGIEEIKIAGNPLSAAEMVLIRLGFVSDLPTPAELLKKHKNTPQAAGAGSVATAAAPVAVTASAPVVSATVEEAPASVLQEEAAPINIPTTGLVLDSFEAVVALCFEKKETILATQLKSKAQLVNFSPLEVTLSFDDKKHQALAKDLRQHLSAWTGESWNVILSDEAGAATLADQQKDTYKKECDVIEGDSIVHNIKDAFPDAEITEIN
ncbi:MAG: DNA polymerase III subunit gamma/tau [Alphaproteobacteria bacterium]